MGPAPALLAAAVHRGDGDDDNHDAICVCYGGGATDGGTFPVSAPFEYGDRIRNPNDR